MPKTKTRKAVAKRFKRTASGLIKRARGGKSHLATSKSRKRKRRLKGTIVTSSAFEKGLSISLGK